MDWIIDLLFGWLKDKAIDTAKDKAKDKAWDVAAGVAGKKTTKAAKKGCGCLSWLFSWF